MKRILIILPAFLFTLILWAQVPQKISYQAVIRNSDDALVTNTRIGMQISILQGSPDGIIVYTETHKSASNDNGLVSIEIGGGERSWWKPRFDSVDWSAGPYFIKTETDLTGGSSYSISGVSQLLAVPFALHAKTAEIVSGTITETDPLFGSSVAGGITETNTEYWNNKQDQLVAGRGIKISGNVIRVDYVNLDSIQKRETADSIAKTFGELTVDVPSEELYDLYNQFCLTHFGAEVDPLVYETLGEKLEIKEGSNWEYISEKSASISWKTNLPAKTFVEYGTTQTYGEKTDFPERYFYIHLHYLKNLQPNTTYHYRLVSVDERGNKTESQDKTFSTDDVPNAIYIPGDLGNPPYILDQANSVYVVTQDIDADRTAFDIQSDNITLDLGGHTVTHGNELISDLNHWKLEKSGVGIRRKGDKSKQAGIKIFNGILKQGIAENNTDYYAAENMLNPDKERQNTLWDNMNKGFSNIELSYCNDVEIAGVTAEYRWHQTWGMRFEYAFDTYNIHHNVCLDKGTQMFSRHGAGGGRSIGFRYSATGDLNHDDNEIQVHHNLIKRTRQNGLNTAQQIYDNEIYVDSWVVNSFAISPHNRNGQVFNNNIFLTGYYACGILWATTDLNAHHNFIHMESISTMIERPNEGRRLIEDWGEQDVLAGLRLTNYGSGGQQRENLTYADNLILGRCRGDVEMRGTEFFSDYSVKNLVCENTVIKIMAQDNLVRKAACVDTQGAYNDRSKHLQLFYKNCDLISNICNVRFGDDYGQGSNHQFIECNIVKADNHPDYHTFEFDGHKSLFNHGLLDCEFIGGAKYNDVYWTNTLSQSDYRVKWTLTLETSQDAMVTITDKNGDEAFTGNSGDDGIISVPLVQSIIRPVEWNPEGKEVEVTKRSQYQEEQFNPYTIKVEKDGKQATHTIMLEEKTTLSLQL